MVHIVTQNVCTCIAALVLLMSNNIIAQVVCHSIALVNTISVQEPRNFEWLGHAFKQGSCTLFIDI